MKVFSGYAKHVLVIRKEDHYMSQYQACKLARHIGDVFDFIPERIAATERYLRYGVVDFDKAGFVPYEIDAIKGLCDWFSVEDRKTDRDTSFIIVDLNSGKTLVVASLRVDQ
jgi:hypothetical protein